MEYAIQILETHLYSLSLNKSMINNKKFIKEIKKAIKVLHEKKSRSTKER